MEVYEKEFLFYLIVVLSIIYQCKMKFIQNFIFQL